MINFADIVLLGLVGLFAVFGFLNGFRKSLVSLIGFTLSLVIAVFAARLTTRALMSVDFFGNLVAGRDGWSIYSFIHRFLVSELDNITVLQMRDAYYYGGEPAVAALFQSPQLNLGWIFMAVTYPLVRSAAVNPMFLNSGLVTARDLFALELSYGVAIFIVGVLLFIAVRIIVACISLALKTKNKKKNFFGRIFGAGLSAARGVLYAAVILSLFTFMSGLAFMNRPMEEVRNSAIVAPLSRGTSAVTELVLRGRVDDRRFEMLLEVSGFDNQIHHL